MDFYFTLLSEFFYQFMQCNHFFNCLWLGCDQFRGQNNINIQEKNKNLIFIPVQTFLSNFTVKFNSIVK